MSGPVSDVQNVKIGVCRVTYNGSDLGVTQGGVTVTVTTQKHQVNVDQFGKSTIKEIILSRDVKVKVPMAETTLDNLVSIMPGATKVVDATTPTKVRVDVALGIGTDLRSIAKVLTLHPTALPDTDLSEDFTVPLAATGGDVSFDYQLEKERIFSVEFTGYPDNTTQKLFSMGDTTATA